MSKHIFCLMGPTASGKTPLAVELVQRFPFEIISVDSACVYRGMDIGTAKPTKEILHVAPHRLIDFLDPRDAYSAGQFRADALHAIDEIFNRGKIPLLVGGTMLYFRILQRGLADLPQANSAIRESLTTRAMDVGWKALHAELATIDAHAAERIHPHDSQRIQRALEIFQLTGKTISAWQAEQTNPLTAYKFYHFALTPDREQINKQIAQRFSQMLAVGFVDEVKRLYKRGDLTADLPSIRSVGYAQVWDYLRGFTTYEEMCEKAMIATRQLAKRQMTWLRSWPDLVCFEDASAKLYDVIEMQMSG